MLLCKKGSFASFVLGGEEIKKESLTDAHNRYWSWNGEQHPLQWPRHATAQECFLIQPAHAGSRPTGQNG